MVWNILLAAKFLLDVFSISLQDMMRGGTEIVYGAHFLKICPNILL